MAQPVLAVDDIPQIEGTHSNDFIVLSGQPLLKGDGAGKSWRFGNLEQLTEPRTEFGFGSLPGLPGEPLQVAMTFKLTVFKGAGFEALLGMYDAEITFIHPAFQQANDLFQVGEVVSVLCFAAVHSRGIETHVKKK
jgi:hypothetical protein